MKPLIIFRNGKWITLSHHFKRLWKHLTFVEQQNISKAYAWCRVQNKKD